jgi:glucosamine--fructose-6-phosphate aminotransferase (isomerizing)
MCGIVGYVGNQKAVPILLKGLSHLEYRGYDSAGVACFDPQKPGLRIYKEKGKLQALSAKVTRLDWSCTSGIGHTRWATHGEPSRLNAHPHTDCRGKLALVHNGIVENYAELRHRLIRKGHRFRSETDTEVLVHLIEEYDRGDLSRALRLALKEAQGYFAFVLMSADDPDKLYVFKRSNPLVIGLGKGENFVASDVPALLPYTREVLFLNDDEYGVIQRNRVDLYSLQNHLPVNRKHSLIEWSVDEAQKGGFPHYMLKEIYEQPRVVQTILETRFRGKDILFENLTPRIRSRLKAIQKIHFVSCGTAYHAGLVGNYMMGECVYLPVETTVSSEFRYEDPAVGREDLVILITQSGETADTLAALREAKNKGALTLAIVNVVGSTIAREADSVIYTHAGPEIGVASTKAYLAQLTVIALLSLYLGKMHPKRRRDLTSAKIRRLLRELRKLPDQIEKALGQESVIEKCARKLCRKENFLYLGRGYNFPNALEGALKLKEITYAHAHGYPAGEMKHGPIALIDSEQPVICICPARSKTYEKMVSNIEEIRARKGIIISIGTQGDKRVPRLSNTTFFIPETAEMLSPILTAVPLQLFAYKIAVLNRRDVDQPRNLAKSVTVE